MSILYMVGTPIGNLKDITYRAVEILAEVDIVACEDTRQTRKILNHFNISEKRLISCRAANESESAKGIVGLMEQGKSVAYASDAGMPGVSDPGSILVRTVKDAGFEVLPVPGVSAAATAVSIAGFRGKGFCFEGFLPVKKGKREKALTALLEKGEIFILYESPFRLIKLLEELKILSPERICLVCREMTKKFEEYLEGTPEILLAELQKRSKIKGEITIIIEGKKKSKC